MRNISVASLTSLQKSSGLEPVILVRIFWGGASNFETYADRKFESFGYQGKMLEISGIEDVLDINNSAASASVDVILDDTDGTLKTIFNSKDIHKTRAQVLQWFTELPPDEAFVIFEGEISSPITWKESDRTLSFTILTRLEDREVGYSVEEGTMTNVPSSFFGRAWPMVFGTVGGVPCLPINEAPVLITQEGIGIVDTEVWDEELAKLQGSVNDAYNQWNFAFTQGLREAYIAARYKSDFPAFGLIDDPEQANAHDDAAQNYFAQAAQYWADFSALSEELTFMINMFNTQKAIDGNTRQKFKAFGKNIPLNIVLNFQINDYAYTGKYNGSEVVEINRIRIDDYNREIAYNDVAQTPTLVSNKSRARGTKFQWIEAGTEVTFLQYPLNYIVGIGQLTILSIYGKKKGIPVTLPQSYYSIVHETTGNLIFTRLLITRPLSTRKLEDWDGDELFANVNNAIGPNIIDIFEWVIQTFTDYTFDPVSFADVKTKVANYPANFALLDRKNVIDFLREVAFQSRCAIWLNDLKFFVRYLPELLPPVESITLQDVVINTLEITSTETERLVTKFVALWKYGLDQEEDSKIIYKYNIQRYGTLVEEYNFYIYNQESLVQKSAEFWLIRKANTYKILRFKSAIHKLKLEALDPVLINMPSNIACDVPVVGIVLKAVYDSETNLIDMEVWIPVRFGENVPFDYAYPKDLDQTKIYPIPNDPALPTGNPFDNASGDLIDPNFIPAQIPFVRITKGEPWNWGRDGPVGDSFDTIPDLPPNVTQLAQGELIPNVPPGLPTFNNTNNYQVQPTQPVVIAGALPASFPGFVLNRIAGNEYSVSVFMRGPDNFPVNITVLQFYQRTDEEIPPGTPCVVHRLIYRLDDGSQTVKFFMQVPVWVSPQEA